MMSFFSSKFRSAAQEKTQPVRSSKWVATAAKVVLPAALFAFGYSAPSYAGISVSLKTPSGSGHVSESHSVPGPSVHVEMPLLPFGNQSGVVETTDVDGTYSRETMHMGRSGTVYHNKRTSRPVEYEPYSMGQYRSGGQHCIADGGEYWCCDVGDRLVEVAPREYVCHGRDVERERWRTGPSP